MSALRLVAVLGVIRLVQLVSAPHGHSVGALTVALIVGGLAVGAGLGVVRALTVRVWRDSSGTVLRQGTAVTAVLWVASLIAHLGIDVAVDRSTSAAALGSAGILLYLAVTLGIQREVVRARATQLAR